MLTGLDIKDAAAALGIHPTTVLRRIKDGRLKANKLGSRWEVYFVGKGCSLCEVAGVRTILVRCATCQRYFCGYHSLSICKGGQHGLSRVADA